VGVLNLCGILGYFSDINSQISSAKFNESLYLLQHRGPDDQGYKYIDHQNWRGFIGQTRLSIIDLSENGHQPFESEDGRFSLVYNGEIYNYIELKDELFSLGHKFRSKSDTEVLLHAWMEWGESSLSKLVGMFSFAILDAHYGTLHCARDPFGIKPLFVKYSNNQFIFASELDAISKLDGQPLVINHKSANEFLLNGSYDRDNSTFIEGINQILPGHVLKMELGMEDLSIKIARWWQPEVVEVSNLSFKDAAIQLRELFLNSVKLHMRSDVKIASALSGGVDSSAILCALRKLEPDADIYSFSYVSSEEETSEEKWIDKINMHVSAQPNKIYISKDVMFQELDDLIAAQGEPFGSTSIYAQYKVFESAKKSGIKVVLDGQGADEIFAGYHGYQNSRIDTLMDQKKYLELFSFLYYWGKYPGRPKSLTYQYAISKTLTPRSKRFILQFRSKVNHPDWLVSAGDRIDYADNDILDIDVFLRRRVSRQLLSDLTSTSIPALLRHADRNSMHWSVESRVPFLNSEIVNFALSLPENYLISGKGETKSVLRAALVGIVPDEVLFRKDKIGFQTPEISLLRNSRFLSVIKDFDYGNGVLLDKKSTIEFASKFVNGHNSDARSFWRIYNLIRWCQLSGVRL
jgi:asparagine synthase (glutamine-hydrolysing)